MKTRRFATACGVIAVALVAGAISYRHQVALAAGHGQPYGLAAIYPLCVDGLVTVAAIAMSTDRAAGFRPRLWSLVGFWTGVAVSVTTNWLATTGGAVAHGISAFPALAFLMAVETLGGKPRPRKQPAQIAAEPSAAPTRYRAIPETAGLTIERATRPRASVPAAAKRVPSNADRVARTAVKHPAATAPEIARKLGLSESTVRRHLATIVTGTLPVTDSDSVPVNGRSFEAVNIR